MVMKQISSPMKMREFLKYDLDRYLNGRSSERDVEQPLYRVENQSHIHYGKGSVILYALQDYIGEDSVNAALKAFLSEWAYKEPPYPTSMDFLKHLEPRVPDSLNYLIDDWFKKITLYDYRLEDADYIQLPDGGYEVNMRVYAQKVTADSLGNESYSTPNDWVYIGLFSDEDEEHLMVEHKVKFDQDSLEFTIRTDSLPAKAAIDPRRVLIERVYSDNIKTLKEKG
jgi:aminopeptidase N